MIVKLVGVCSNHNFIISRCS